MDARAESSTHPHIHTSAHPPISVILPVLNEAASLPATLASLAPYQDRIEAIAVDGGSSDDSVAILRAHPWIRVLASARGRARQMNAGALAASGDVLLFLHADTRLEGGWFESIQETIARPRFILGAFRFALDGRGIGYRLLELGVAARCRLLKLPYGDQALFMRAEVFRQREGFKDIPLMEDVDLVARNKPYGRFYVARRRAFTSPRRWERDGLVRRSLRNVALLVRYLRGDDPRDLARAYDPNRAAIGVFCKRPDPGLVKTRLASSIGSKEAAAVYRSMAELTFQTVQACGGRPTVYAFIDPPHAQTEMETWLGPSFVYQPQARGDLGMRMQEALAWLFDEGFGCAVLIGTDCPALAPRHIDRAFTLLDGHDIVVGPAADGGYYLIGMKKPWPELFDSMAWSTGEVLAETVKRAERIGATVAMLEELRDLDDARDLEFYQAERPDLF